MNKGVSASLSAICQQASAVAEAGTVKATFEVYIWSETEQTIFGQLAGMKGRPAAEKGRIRALCERFLAEADPPAAFRDWFEAVGNGGGTSKP